MWEIKEIPDIIFGDRYRALGIRGMNVSMPYKSDVIPFLDRLDTAAQVIGAVNTIHNRDGFLTGYNTDFIGARRALEEACSLKGARVALLGAGGAARAIAYALKEAGAVVLVFNRTVKHVTKLNCIPAKKLRST